MEHDFDMHTDANPVRLQYLGPHGATSTQRRSGMIRTSIASSKNLVGVYRDKDGTYPENIIYAMKSDDSELSPPAGGVAVFCERQTRTHKELRSNGGKSATENYQAGFLDHY